MLNRLHTLLTTILLTFVVLGSVLWVESADTQVTPAAYLPVISSAPQPPKILEFKANIPLADPGQTITLSWKTSHATTVTLYHLFGGVLSTFWDVAPNGTMTYAISSSSRNTENFALFAGNDDFPFDSASLLLPLTCPSEWFFTPAPNICPQDAALRSDGAEQRFERGSMIWVKEEDRIYVLFDDTIYADGWSAFEDSWESGDPVDDPTIVPPPGLYQPQRGFGVEWRNQPQVRVRLGWALAPEAAGTTIVQRTSYFKYNHIYLKALDGDVWHLLPERSDWRKFTPQTVEN